MFSQAFIMYICSIGTGVNVGFPGVSTLANSTLVSLEGAQARRFFGLLMPVLLAADGYAVYAYRKTVRWDIVRDMVLPIAVGMFAGFLLLGRFNSKWMRKLLGVGVLGRCRPCQAVFARTASRVPFAMACNPVPNNQ